MTPEHRKMLSAIGSYGGSLSTIDGLVRATKLDYVEVRRQVHHLIGMGLVRARVAGAFGVTCYALTVDGNAELMADVAS